MHLYLCIINSQHKFTIMQVFTLEQTAAMYGITVERLKEQYRFNAEGMQRMYDKALETGKKVGGFTAGQLKAKVEEFKKLAQ